MRSGYHIAKMIVKEEYGLMGEFEQRRTRGDLAETLEMPFAK